MNIRNCVLLTALSVLIGDKSCCDPRGQTGRPRFTAVLLSRREYTRQYAASMIVITATGINYCFACGPSLAGLNLYRLMF